MLNRFNATVWNNTNRDGLDAKQKRRSTRTSRMAGVREDDRRRRSTLKDPRTAAGWPGRELEPLRRVVFFPRKPWLQRGFKVRATLDENVYSRKRLWKDIRMDADYLMIWKHCVARGRVFYSAPGHAASTCYEPLHLAELEDGIAW